MNLIKLLISAEKKMAKIETLANGGAHEETYSWPYGWTISARYAPILKNDRQSFDDNSQNAWCREMNLTLYANQHFPEATFGGNYLELLHRESGVCLSFSTLEALRAWALYRASPVPHLCAEATPCPWDYTFTTPYAGSTTFFRKEGAKIVPPQPDGKSVYSRPSIDLASGPAKLRKPLCKCINGGAPLVSPLFQNRPNFNFNFKRLKNENLWCNQKQRNTAWLPTSHRIDFENLMKNNPVPMHRSKIDFWINNLDPQSFSFLRAKIFVCAEFWALCLRCFVRVNGVMARVIETRFLCSLTLGSGIVLREQSWREGSWEELVGKNKGTHVMFPCGDGDETAVQRLPLVQPTVTEILDVTKLSPCISLSSLENDILFQKPFLTSSCESISFSETGLACFVMDEGSMVEMVCIKNGVQWRKKAPLGTFVVSVSINGKQGCVAVGTENGQLHLWRIEDGKSLYIIPIATSLVHRCVWVEHIVWAEAENDHLLACSAGKDVVIISSTTGTVVRSTRLTGTVQSLAFSKEFLAIASYSTISWLTIDESCLEKNSSLIVGATAVLSVAISPDGFCIATGCLDGRVRLFDLSKKTKRYHETCDWIGMNGAVNELKWSSCGKYLALLTGIDLIIIPRNLKRGESPIHCESCVSNFSLEKSNCRRKEKCFSAISWSPIHTELVALNARSGHIYMFNPEIIDGSVPRRAFPVSMMNISERFAFFGLEKSITHQGLAVEIKSESDCQNDILWFALNNGIGSVRVYRNK
eukprot:g3301.t1